MQEEGLSPEQLIEIKEMFDLYDTDRSGYLGIKEFAEAMRTSGLEKEEINKLFKDIDVDDDNQISCEEFAELMKSTGLYDLK